MIPAEGADVRQERATPAPGWYTDPRSAEQLRYWDGDSWTRHTRDHPRELSSPRRTHGASVVQNSTLPSGWSRQQRTHVLVVVAAPAVLIIAVLLFTIGQLDVSFGAGAPNSPSPTSSPMPSTPIEPVVADAGVETSTTTTTTGVSRATVSQPEDPGELGAGVHVVGSDIMPGLYRVSVSWARLDENMDVIDNDLTLTGVTLMPVFASDAFIELTGTAVPIVEMPVIDVVDRGLTQGTYLVGPDIDPGTYRVTAEPGATAFAARLSADLQVIEDKRDDVDVEIVLASSDFAFRYTGSLEPIG